MITFNHNSSLKIETVNKAIWMIGLATLAALALAVLWLCVWILQEAVLAVALLCHMLSTANPLILSSLIVLVAVWLIGKKKGK